MYVLRLQIYQWIYSYIWMCLVVETLHLKVEFTTKQKHDERTLVLKFALILLGPNLFVGTVVQCTATDTHMLRYRVAEVLNEKEHIIQEHIEVCQQRFQADIAYKFVRRFSNGGMYFCTRTLFALPVHDSRIAAPLLCFYFHLFYFFESLFFDRVIYL